VITQSDFLPQLPFYLCQRCFHEFGLSDEEFCVAYPHIDHLKVDQ
jgi:hypothetical protein